jgi:hypothetical protein
MAFSINKGKPVTKVILSDNVLGQTDKASSEKSKINSLCVQDDWLLVYLDYCGDGGPVDAAERSSEKTKCLILIGEYHAYRLVNCGGSSGGNNGGGYSPPDWGTPVEGDYSIQGT